MKTSELPRRLFRTRRVSRRSFDRFVTRALKAIRRKRAAERARPKPGVGLVRGLWTRHTLVDVPAHTVWPHLVPKPPSPRAAATAAAVVQVGRIFAHRYSQSSIRIA